MNTYTHSHVHVVGTCGARPVVVSTCSRSTGRRRRSAASGQVSVFGASILLFLVIMIFSLRLAEEQWADVNNLNASLRSAAIAGSHVLSPQSLVAPVQSNDSTQAFVPQVALDATDLGSRSVEAAELVLRDNLWLSYGNSPTAAVDTTEALQHVAYKVHNFVDGYDYQFTYSGTVGSKPVRTLVTPVSPGLPTRTRYSEICIEADIDIGLISAGGLRLPHHLSTCAQAVF